VVINDSLFGKCLFNSIAHLLIGLISFLLYYFTSLYVLDIDPLSDEYPANIFSDSIGCLVIMLFVSFAEQVFDENNKMLDLKQIKLC
jgi:hypothetical protein